MRAYGKKYKQGFIIEAWENSKNHWVKTKKRERQQAKQQIKRET